MLPVRYLHINTANTIVGTCADDTVLLSAASDHRSSSTPSRNGSPTGKLKINESKSSFVTYSHSDLITAHPYRSSTTSSFLIQWKLNTWVLHLTCSLTWSLHLKEKRDKLNSRLHLLRPLFRSNLTIYLSKLFSTILFFDHLGGGYGVVIWGSPKKSNKRTIQAFQNICLRLITGALFFISDESLNSDLKLSINGTAAVYYKRFHVKLQDNPNLLINELASLTLPGNPTRRLKRNWFRDLKT